MHKFPVKKLNQTANLSTVEAVAKPTQVEDNLHSRKEGKMLPGNIGRLGWEEQDRQGRPSQQGRRLAEEDLDTLAKYQRC